MKRSRETLNLDLIPLIDVILFLLIFFMVATVFKSDEKALSLELPKTVASTSSDKNILTVEITADKIALNGRVVDVKQLSAEVSRIEDKTQKVTMRIDKNAKYEKIAETLAIFQTNGLNSLTLVTD